MTKAQLAKLPYLMCDFTLSEAGVFIRSLFPRNHIFRLDVDNSSKLLPYLENGLGYSFLPYKLVKEKIENGTLEEAWGTGTAAVVSPIGKLAIGDKEYVVGGGKIGEVTAKLYDTLTGIQWGKRPDTFGWVYKL